jgi:hypothetical protein
MGRTFKRLIMPSFWEGIARLIDVGGTLNEYHRPTSSKEADLRAIESDWEAVAGDIVAATEKFRRRNRESVGG